MHSLPLRSNKFNEKKPLNHDTHLKRHETRH